jgi:hypothetical protein
MIGIILYNLIKYIFFCLLLLDKLYIYFLFSLIIYKDGLECRKLNNNCIGIFGIGIVIYLFGIYCDCKYSRILYFRIYKNK